MSKKSRFLCMFLCQVIIICMFPSIFVYAAGANSVTDSRIVSVNTLNMIEQLSDEIVELRIERSEIAEDDYVRLNDIDSKINKKKEQMESLGAEEVDDELFCNLVTAALETDSQDGIIAQSAWHPSEIVEQFKELYDVMGVSVAYGGQTQYHLIFSSIGQDRNLHRSTSKKIYDSFEANSNECKNFINDLIKVYAAKVVNVIIGDSIINLTPWELLFNDKPQANQLSSNGDALYATLNTVSVQKFVFVYDTAKDDWVYCLSTNKVSCSLSVTAALCINGRAVNQSKDYGPTWIYGDWNNASQDANFAYNSGIEMETCISEVRVESTSKNKVEVVNYIHTPKYVAHML